MWTHRQVTPFTRFLPVLGFSTTEQHVLLPSTFWAPLSWLYLPLAVARHIFYPWEIVCMTPFGTTNLLPVSPERLLPIAVELWRISMETPSQDFRLWVLPLSRFRDELTSPRMASAAFSQWYESSCLSLLDDFRSTTFLNSSPLLVGRHAVRPTPSQAKFSLSKAFAYAQEPVIPPEFLWTRERGSQKLSF